MPGVPTLLVYLVTGIFGMAYFVYGKRQQNTRFLFAGAGLCLYPYVVDSLVLLILIGLVLLAAPFLVGRQ